MYILIANPGSTSYKCKLYLMPQSEIVFEAVVERIGHDDAIFSYKFSNQTIQKKVIPIQTYSRAIDLTLEQLKQKFSMADLAAVGFKTVLAKGVTGCILLNEKVQQAMKDFRALAPVHTDVYLQAIQIFSQLLPQTPLIGLFETHFHQNIPLEAALYGIPFEYYQQYGIRKYGFHGASHRYIGQRAKELFGATRVISCHLGGSSSVCAIKDGWSVDTSMGMSPQSGLLNAKRVGDLDAYALLYLMEQEVWSIENAREILAEKSGLFGIYGKSGDLRDIEQAMEEGDERAELAFKTFAYYVKRYIGEYMAVLNGAECIVFTAGAGQNSPKLRSEILNNMDGLGIILDEKKNSENPKEGLISAKNSTVKIAVIPTNEESIVANAIYSLLNN